MMTGQSSMKIEPLLKTIRQGESMDFYVMPTVNVRREDGEGEGAQIAYHENTLLTYQRHGNIFTVMLEGWELGDPGKFRPGQKITMYGPDEGIYVSKYVPYWKTGAILNKTKFCYGQSILISAAPGGGKTTAVQKLCKSFERHPNCVSYRLLFGERKDDSLYAPDELQDLTIDSDSSAPIRVQLNTVYVTITKALIDAYEGKNAVLAIDSLTRMINGLTGLYATSHMVAGGISYDVSIMVSNLFRMGGGYGKGTLTVIGTCFYSVSNNTWKNVYTELSAAANGEIKTAKVGDKYVQESDTRRSEKIRYPYFVLFGRRYYY